MLLFPLFSPNDALEVQPHVGEKQATWRARLLSIADTRSIRAKDCNGWKRRCDAHQRGTAVSLYQTIKNDSAAILLVDADAAGADLG